MYLTPDLFEKVFLLLLTALISGWGIPRLLKRIEERKLREQKLFEAELARQAKIIEAQSRLLDDLSQLLWRWRYLAKKVVYYGAERDRERFLLAGKQYEEGVWDILHDFRIQISRSRRLVSEPAFQRLDALYDYVVRDLDVAVTAAIRGGVAGDLLDPLTHRFSGEVTQRLDAALDDLASELKLKVKA